MYNTCTFELFLAVLEGKKLFEKKKEKKKENYYTIVFERCSIRNKEIGNSLSQSFASTKNIVYGAQNVKPLICVLCIKGSLILK